MGEHDTIEGEVKEMHKILVVEDDTLIVRNLSELLRQEGFAVTTASGQKEALQAAENVGFDLALLDISLLDGNGFSLCKSLLSRMAQKLGPHIVQYSPSVTALSL